MSANNLLPSWIEINHALIKKKFVLFNDDVWLHIKDISLDTSIIMNSTGNQFAVNKSHYSPVFCDIIKV